MLHCYLRKMKSKELFITHNISISKNIVFFDGQTIYNHQGENDFTAFSKDLYKKIECNYPKFYKMDNLCKLSFLAGELLTKRSRLSEVPSEKVSLIFANTGSTIDTDIKFIESFATIPSPAIFVYTLPNIAIGELCIRHGWKGEGIFLVQSQFNPQELIDHAGFIFQSGFAKVCILGWVEFLSSDNFQTHLWLISDSFNKSDRLLSAVALAADYDMHL
jgi:hypothetical protein